MKIKYKYYIFGVIVIVSLAWGLFGGWLYYYHSVNNWTSFIPYYIIYVLALAIPIKIISNKARKDMPPNIT